MINRIEAILGMLAKTPDDVFLNYSLGMEYASAGRYDEAAGRFKRCSRLDENYIAAYVEAGKSLRSAGRLDEARKTFAAAIKLTATQGESHVRDYIQQQIDSLPRE